MWRGVNGRKVIVELFVREIPKRRAGQATDLFSELCRATKEDGSLLSDQEIADHMSFLMMAAHDTLTSSVTSLVYMLAKNPRVAGQAARGDARAQSAAPARRCPTSGWANSSCSRWPSRRRCASIRPCPASRDRRCATSSSRAIDIPAGTRVSINVIFTHRMPEIWPEPETFDPLRFTDEAVRARHKYAWVPYSGGAHMCLGLHFAYMQAKSFFYHLLTTTRVSVEPGYSAALADVADPQAARRAADPPRAHHVTG